MDYEEELLTQKYDSNIVESDALIEAYTDMFTTGGNLHIVLDDGNIDDVYIHSCKAWCQEANDVIGERICDLLINLPLVIRDIVCRNNDYDWYTVVSDAKSRLTEKLSK